jgi:hypothetical protein
MTIARRFAPIQAEEPALAISCSSGFPPLAHSASVPLFSGPKLSTVGCRLLAALLTPSLSKISRPRARNSFPLINLQKTGGYTPTWSYQCSSLSAVGCRLLPPLSPFTRSLTKKQGGGGVWSGQSHRGLPKSLLSSSAHNTPITGNATLQLTGRFPVSPFTLERQDAERILSHRSVASHPPPSYLTEGPVNDNFFGHLGNLQATERKARSLPLLGRFFPPAGCAWPGDRSCHLPGESLPIIEVER